MLKKIIILVLFSYFLILLQMSFLIHFKFLANFPNLVLILVILFSFLENPKDRSGIFFGFFGGFLSDIFSQNLIGFNILIFTVIAIFIKKILRKYVWIPVFKRV